MRSSDATVEACVNLVFVGHIPNAIGKLFNDVSAEERRVIHYAIVEKLISRKVHPATIASYRDMVRGCAYDCGLEDPNVQSKWTDEDHISNATGETNHGITAIKPCNLTAGSGNTWPAIAEIARAARPR